VATAPIQFRVETNAAQVRRQLRHLAQDQVPYAMARALGDVAIRGRDAARRDMRRAFTVRKGNLEKAVGHVKARKKDWPHNLHAAVTVQEWADFLAHHVTGKRRRPRGKKLAVPTRFVHRKRTSTGRVPKGLSPRGTMAKPSGYIEDGAIRRRRGKRARIRVAILHHLVPSVRIRPRWPFYQLVRKATRGRLAPAYRRRMLEAVATRRAPR